MPQQNDAPRSNQNERANERTEEYSSKSLSESSNADKSLTKVNNSGTDASSTRTPERWWLRKRLMH